MPRYVFRRELILRAYSRPVIIEADDLDEAEEACFSDPPDDIHSCLDPSTIECDYQEIHRLYPSENNSLHAEAG